MKHPVFGRIKRTYDDPPEWSGLVRIPFFAGYDASAEEEPDRPRGKRSLGGMFTAAQPRDEFDLELRGAAAPSADQEAAFRAFQQEAELLCGRVADAVYDLYRSFWADLHRPTPPGQLTHPIEERLFPELTDRDGLKRLIRFEGLSLIHVPGCDQAVLGFCFHCTWDIEHGLGVLVHQGEIVEIGENDLTWREADLIDLSKRVAPVEDWLIQAQRGIAAVKRLGGGAHCDRDASGVWRAEVDFCANPGVADTDLNALDHFSNLSQLHIRSANVTDRGLEGLLRHVRLRELHLSDCTITDAGLATLQGLKALEILDLGGTKITDVGLEALCHLPALSELHVNRTAVTDAGLKAVGALQSLVHLDLSGTRVTGEGLAELRNLTRLSRLTLESTQVADASLAALAGLAALTRLNLTGTAITDAGLARLRELPSLKQLRLRSTGVALEGPSALADFPSLYDLDLESARVTDAGLIALGGLPGLRYLNLNRCPITDAGLARLEPLSGLRSLKIASTGVTRKGIRKLREAIPNLQID